MTETNQDTEMAFDNVVFPPEYNSFVGQDVSNTEHFGDGQPLNWEDCDRALKREAEGLNLFQSSISGANTGRATLDGQAVQPLSGLSEPAYYSSNSSGFSPNSDSSNSNANSGNNAPSQISMQTQESDPKNADEETEKKKAQNRAAQRAFRERRTQLIKELETKLASVEAENAKLKSTLDKITRENTVLSTENKVLKQQQLQAHVNNTDVPRATHPSKVTFPKSSFFETLLDSEIHGKDALQQPSYAVYESKARHTVMLGAGAVWKKLIEDPTIPDNIDFDMIIDSLKDKAVCDGNGPVFPQYEVDKAVQRAIAEAMRSQ